MTDASVAFRDHYLSYEELTTQLQIWAKEHPEFVELVSLTRTAGGREVWLLKVGRQDLDPRRPAAWVDGNMHASELTGSSAALSIAADLINVHLGRCPHSLSKQVLAVLRDSLVYVLPRMSPDGAEAVLRTGRYIRSVDRSRRPGSAPRWICEDVDGDGLALVMRQEDPGGQLVESQDIAGLLVPRTVDDEGPFYKLYPEGRIENFDGHTIPSPNFLDDNYPDLNRNFPHTWAAEPMQIGAGDFPLSEAESRAVVEFATAHSNIFAWLNLHTFGGVHIRPLGDQPDNKMHPFDLAVFRQIEEWAEQFGGYPTVSGFEEFTYEPEKPLHGELSDYAYHQRGCIAWVCELWDLFDQVGLPRPERFVDRYFRLGRPELEQLARWDAAENEGRVMRPWREVEHPQLGAVEVGGIDPRIGLWNPPLPKLAGVCDDIAQIFLRVIAMAPRLTLSVEATPVEEGLHRVTAVVDNVGYLPTYVLPSAESLPWNTAPVVQIRSKDCEVLNPATSRVQLDHLEGWGEGRWGPSAPLYFQRTPGSGHRAVQTWLVRGAGAVTIDLQSARAGNRTEQLTLSR